MRLVTRIHDLVRSGRITAEQGAWLLELRRKVEWHRRPWWSKALCILARAVFG